MNDDPQPPFPSELPVLPLRPTVVLLPLTLQVHIARRYLVPRQLQEHGLTDALLALEDVAMTGDITFEPVRTLEDVPAVACRSRPRNQSSSKPAAAHPNGLATVPRPPSTVHRP